METACSGPGDLSVGSGRVGAAGIAGRWGGVHRRLTHVEKTHVQLEVTAPTGLGHVGAERGLWGREGGGFLSPLASDQIRLIVFLEGLLCARCSTGC